jgi:hypothetical protein
MQQTITRRIRQRTNDRLQLLHVEVQGDTITVRGRSPNYHIKQLALQGVIELLGANRSWQFEHKIEVTNTPALSATELPLSYMPLPESQVDVSRAMQIEYADATREACTAGYWK